MGNAWFDTGSGLQVNDPFAIQQAQIAQRSASDAQLPNLAGYTNLDELYPVIEAITGHLGIQQLVRMIELGKLDPNVAAQLGPYVAARQDEASSHSGLGGAINDFLGTELTHFENLGESWQNDPERLALGINTPLESKLWGGLLGKDYDPNVNMYGGPTKDTYREAAENGYDPRFDAAGHNATQGIIGGMFGQKLAGTSFGQSAYGPAATGAARAGATALDEGEDPWKRALMAAIASGAESAAGADFDFGGAGETAAPMQVADAGTATTDVGPGMMPPAILDTGGAPMMPSATPPVDPTFGGALFEAAPGMFQQASSAGAEPAMPPATPESGDPTQPPAPAPEPAVSPETVQRLARIAKTLYDVLGKPEGEAPEGAPTQEDAEDDAHYGEELAQYLELDPASMAEQGLEPGSQEYYDYIMSRADQVIANVLGDMDVDAEDFSAQLRAKTDAELQQLQRALYVRGQMGQLMGSGTYTDPATGGSEEVIGSGMFNPGTAAFQRGLARSVGELASAGDPRAYLDRWLGRDVDFYGMQGQADQRYQDALRNETNEDELRKRGMFGGY
jgi:hypothetical protein